MWKINKKSCFSNKFKFIFNDNIISLNGFFKNCKELLKVDLSNFDSTNINDTEEMFSNCVKLNQIFGIEKLKTEKVISMKNMFSHCEKLTNLDLTNFDTINVTNMEGMFCCCKRLKEIKGINRFNTIRVINMKQMFHCCYELENLDFTNFNTSNVINMEGMFEMIDVPLLYKINEFIFSKKSFNHIALISTLILKYTFPTIPIIVGDILVNIPLKPSKLKEIKFSKKFNTKNVVNMKEMFNNCTELKNLDLSNFDTSNVSNMNCIFSGCEKIKFLDLTTFDTSNVTDMDGMFSGCKSLEEIKGINSLNTKNVSTMRYMFFECKNLKNVDVSNFDTSNLTDINCLFSNCIELTDIKGINNFRTNNVTNMEQMFYNCKKLEKLDLSNFDTSNTINMKEMFCKCDSLNYLNLNNFKLKKDCNTKDIFNFSKKEKCNFITNNENLKNIYNQSSCIIF